MGRAGTTTQDLVIRTGTSVDGSSADQVTGDIAINIVPEDPMAAEIVASKP